MMSTLVHSSSRAARGYRRPRLGIIGGGQLAKMTAQAATRLGVEVIVLERQEDFPAHALDTESLVGDWDNPRDLLRLARLADVITLENEFVSVAALRELPRHGHTLWPHPLTLQRVQDKLRQKQFFAKAGIPVAMFADATSPRAVRRLGLPVVLKKRFYSYDGKGNATVRTEPELESAWPEMSRGGAKLYAERWVEFERELAIIITRGQQGQVEAYPVVETINRNHICHIVKAPADVPAAVADRVRELAVRAIVALDGVGSFGLEFFLMRDGQVLLNEIAPRVHNTGHYTIEACTCSQFENHVRAVMGWPLGSTRMVRPAAVMINLLGAGHGDGTPHGLACALAVDGAHVHIYGKSRSAPGRKMGHVTALGESVDEALAIAETAARQIRFGETT